MSEENKAKFVDLVQVTRGEITENIHQGVAVAMESSGRIIKKRFLINFKIYQQNLIFIILGLKSYK